MDQELIAYLDERFDRIDKRFEQVDKRFEQVDKRMDGLEAAIRGNGVEIEGLRNQIQQVAEGVAAGNENLAALRIEVYERFDEMRQLFNTSHSNLHRRVGVLEGWREQVERRT